MVVSVRVLEFDGNLNFGLESEILVKDLIFTHDFGKFYLSSVFTCASSKLWTIGHHLPQCN